MAKKIHIHLYGTQDAGFTTYNQGEVARLDAEIKEQEAKMEKLVRNSIRPSQAAVSIAREKLNKLKRERAKYHA